MIFKRIDLRHKLAEVFVKACVTTLYDRVGAEIFAFAIFAVTAYPYIVKLIHRLLNDLWLVSQYAGLEVASRVCLHADAGTCEVGAADIHFFTVKHQHLEVHTRAEHSLQSVIQYGILVEILSEVRPRLLCVNESHLHSPPYEQRDESQKRLLLVAHLHIQVLYVGGPNPKSVLHGLHPCQHLFVMLRVGEIFQHTSLAQEILSLFV